jgi:hypothetical protein
LNNEQYTAVEQVAACWWRAKVKINFLQAICEILTSYCDLGKNKERGMVSDMNVCIAFMH